MRRTHLLTALIVGMGTVMGGKPTPPFQFGTPSLPPPSPLMAPTPKRRKLKGWQKAKRR